MNCDVTEATLELEKEEKGGGDERWKRM